MMKPGDIFRLELGHYTMPADSTLSGQKIVACAYVIRFAGGLMLFDTGIGTGHAGAEEEFGPIERRPLRSALAGLSLQPADVSAVANCHLYLDHCGNNQLFPRIPIFVQRNELDALPSLDYVLPGCVDFSGAALEVHDGAADVAPGVRIIPTPGHTPGHQSLLLDTTRGKVLLAGQAMGSASEFDRAQFTLYAGGKRRADEPGQPPRWLEDLRELDIRVALFAHDLTRWEKAVVTSATPAEISHS